MKNSQASPDCPQSTSAILRLKQHYAMELLLVGKSDAEIAALIEVDSDIVRQWQNKDAEFIVAINALRAAAWAGISPSRSKNSLSMSWARNRSALVRES